MLKIVVADGDKAGSVEHPVHAALVDAGTAGSLKLSELMVGDPLDNGDILRPMVGYKITFGSVQGYVEAYGPEAASVAATYEIAGSDTSPALLTADVPGRPAGDDRVLFTRVIPVHELPPGRYVLRAVLSKDGQPVKTMTRAFELAMPAASAAGLGDSSSKDGELFLPIDDARLAGPFHVDEALRPPTLGAFRERLGRRSERRSTAVSRPPRPATIRRPNRASSAASSLTWTARRRSRTSPRRASRHQGATPRPRARGRLRSSTAPTSRRSISGSRTR